MAPGKRPLLLHCTTHAKILKLYMRKNTFKGCNMLLFYFIWQYSYKARYFTVEMWEGPWLHCNIYYPKDHVPSGKKAQWSPKYNTFIFSHKHSWKSLLIVYWVKNKKWFKVIFPHFGHFVRSSFSYIVIFLHFFGRDKKCRQHSCFRLRNCDTTHIFFWETPISVLIICRYDYLS